MQQKPRAITLRVLIVSDVRVVQKGLQSILAQRDDVDRVSTVDMERSSAQSGILHRDVILVDAARQENFEFLKHLVASAPHSKVVAFGVKETDEEILALAADGAAGYKNKRDDDGGVVE